MQLSARDNNCSFSHPNWPPSRLFEIFALRSAAWGKERRTLARSVEGFCWSRGSGKECKFYESLLLCHLCYCVRAEDAVKLAFSTFGFQLQREPSFVRHFGRLLARLSGTRHSKSGVSAINERFDAVECSPVV